MLNIQDVLLYRETYNYFEQRFVRETIFNEKFSSRFQLLLVGWGEKFCYWLSCLKNPPLDGRAHCLHYNATSGAENIFWKHNSFAYLMKEKNVNIWQENLFGVLWGGNVHNCISMFQLNCVVWAYKEAKFGCVGASLILVAPVSDLVFYLHSVYTCVWQLII
jgi:hypothetical protein